MKMAVCTTPIRPYPTDYPPFGSMAIIQSLRTVGVNCDFYDIDYHRYSDQEIENYFLVNQFNIVGISAVVSTAYMNTKKISSIIRKVSPSTLIILGGNMGASAEIVLRKTDIDACVIGDGEITICEIVLRLRDTPIDKTRENIDFLFNGIAGLAYLSTNEEFVFTGFRKAPSEENIVTPDFSILEESNSIGHFVFDVQDPKTLNELRLRFPEIEHPKETTIYAAKGCVARCTFCHRWERGYRVRPIDQLMEHIYHLYNHYGVRSLQFGDENFGSDKEHTRELVANLGKMGIIWEVAGVRARTVSPEEFNFWKMNGCRRAIYGIESGSDTILRVMQKGTSAEQNKNAMTWIYDAGLDTTLQLVIGMPGETDRTINETISFAKTIVDSYTRSNSLPSLNCSINYAQALPGTPLYEYARQLGWLGDSMSSEEDYLVRISNIDAYASDHFINFTGQPLLKVLMWRYRMLGEVDAFYIETRLGIKLTWVQTCRSVWKIASSMFKYMFGRTLVFDSGSPILDSVESMIGKQDIDNSGYFNIQKGVQFSILYFKHLRKVSYPLLAIFVAFRHGKSIRGILKLMFDHIWWSLKKPFVKQESLPRVTLRKLIDVQQTSSKFEGSSEMVAIRLGR